MATNGTTRRLLHHAPAVRVFIGLGAAIGVVTALLVIAQAELLSSTVARAFLGGAGLAELAVPLVTLLGVLLGVTTGRTTLVVTHRPQELPGLPRLCLPTRHDAPVGVAPLT